MGQCLSRKGPQGDHNMAVESTGESELGPVWVCVTDVCVGCPRVYVWVSLSVWVSLCLYVPVCVSVCLRVFVCLSLSVSVCP